MKTTLILTSLFLGLSVNAYAQSQPNLLETTEDARLRHNNERYEEYKKNGNAAPLGGYSEKFGDSAPAGTDRPGYATSPSSNTSGLLSGSKKGSGGF